MNLSILMTSASTVVGVVAIPVMIKERRLRKKDLTFNFTRASIFVDTCNLFANCAARVKALSSFVIDPCTDLTVDTVAIVKPLVLTLFPCAIGMVIKKYCKGITILDGFFGDSQSAIIACIQDCLIDRQ